MRRAVPLTLFALAASACSGGGRGGADPEETAAPRGPAAPGTAPLAVPAPPPGPPPDPLRPRADLPPERRALLFVDGAERVVDAAAASAAGYTLVDLSDDWTPYIFQEFHDEAGELLLNRYRRIFIGLANDRSDRDGRPLPDGAVNYLELYGIPPALSVVRRRWTADEARACHGAIDYLMLASLDTLPLPGAKAKAAQQKKIAALRKKVEEATRKAGLPTIEALAAAEPEWADEVAAVHLAERQRDAFEHVVARLKCDGHMAAGASYKPELTDATLRDALQSFQHRHKIYERPGLRSKTLGTLAKPPRIVNHEAFVRALRERVVAATSVLEDGTVATDPDDPPTWVNSRGEKEPVRNLVEEATRAALEQMGVDTPEGLEAFFARHPEADFRRLQVAVRMPALPEYYAPHMELELTIDRGDVWYAPNWNDTGMLYVQRRERMPKLWLHVRHGKQRIPLVRWPTTIGGWRAEQANNGYEYYRYKGSDVGPRVIRKVLAGPVWVAPPSTPLRGLVKGATVNGARTTIVNYDEMGPGYLSAYGLVAGYFVIPGKDGRPDHDRGIRAHGSSDYMSITSPAKYSHGCHRLLNHLAVRLYGFVLNHRNVVVNGDQPMNMSRQFLQKERVYEIRMPSRGFEFQLEPPLPVNVLEGRVMGPVQAPMDGFIPKPDVRYPPGPVPVPGQSAEARAGAG